MDQDRQLQKEATTDAGEARVKSAPDYMGAAYARLAAVLQPEAGVPWMPGEDPLIIACRMIGACAGIRITAPPHYQESWSSRYFLQEIARLSHFRLRPVQLRGAWWNKDYGPFLGFLTEDRRPVAIIPVKAGQYRLEDPVRQESLAVTPEVAAGLHQDAYVFYRPLPAETRTAWSLIKFGLRGTGPDLLMVAGMGLAGGLLSMVGPIAMGILFDSIIPAHNHLQLLHVTLILIVLAACGFMFNFTRNLAMLRIEGKMDYALQAGIWDHLLKLPLVFFKKYWAGDLALRAYTVTFIRQQLCSYTVTSILTAIFSVFCFALLFYYSWELALLAAGITFLGSVMTIVLGYCQLKYLWPMYNLQGRLSGMALQLFAALSKLRVAGVEERAFAYWTRLFAEKESLALKSRTYANVLTTINSMLPLLATGVMFYWVAIHGHIKISTGGLIAFLCAFGTFFGAMLTLSGNLAGILNIIPLYNRVKPILEGVPETDATQKQPLDLRGAIDVEQVFFRFDPHGPHILKDISFSVAPGEFVALVGPSGAGKSTLLRLLLGFEQTESGAIYFDGQDLAGLDAQAVRRQLGVVLQDGKLIPGDILSNIIGAADLTEADAWDAARLAGLEDDIKAMPMQMHTYISEGGGTFSGGQMQRLLIARALAKKPRILLFDEATNDLDNLTQAIISQNLKELQETRIVIAHRLSTIVHADRILVIDKGTIQQSGTYDELIRQQGLFAELAGRQMA